MVHSNKKKDHQWPILEMGKWKMNSQDLLGEDEAPYRVKDIYVMIFYLYSKNKGLE